MFWSHDSLGAYKSHFTTSSGNPTCMLPGLSCDLCGWAESSRRFFIRSSQLGSSSNHIVVWFFFLSVPANQEISGAWAALSECIFERMPCSDGWWVRSWPQLILVIGSSLLCAGNSQPIVHSFPKLSDLFCRELCGCGASLVYSPSSPSKLTSTRCSHNSLWGRGVTGMALKDALLLG